METVYELKFHWDDQEEAAVRRTMYHRQEGMLKVIKLPNESDEKFKNRAKFYFDKAIRNLQGNLSRRGRGAGIISNTFPKEF
jgi:hypothetical protein